MNSVKVSVIIPVYNVEEFLEECLESVARQTLDSLQIIMVDDGSTDTSGKIAQGYAQKYNYFEYIYQDNGGLGNARNTGVKYSKGEYLVFLDSDDVVPQYAYEKMYRAAKKNNSDMAIGNVIRFNSKKKMPSNIHDIAFRNIIEKTHILENTNLIYDTTAWNKLIKKTFWDKHQFKFPERMLYEDIPVTIPMHYLANNVSMVYDICYLWRVRDGVSKSITQMTNDDVNFNDRLKALRLVDGFFKENVTNESLIYEKHFKWLQVDLMIFINSVIFLKNDIIKKRANAIKSYIEESIPNHIIDKLPALSRFKYQYLLNGEFEKLIRLREYQNKGFPHIKIKKKGTQYFAKFPSGLIPNDTCEMKSTLEHWQLRQAMYKIRHNNNCYIIDGFIYFPALNINWKNAQSLKAYLFQIETNKKIPITIKNCYTFKPTRSYGLKVDNTYNQLNFINYSGSGYQIIIRLQEDIIDNNLQGEFKILLEYERDCWKRQVFLSRTERAAKNKKISSILNDQKIDLEISDKEVLKLHIDKMSCFITESYVQKNHLHIIPNKISTNYYYQFENGSYQKAEVNINENSIDIPFNTIPETGAELGVLNGKSFIPLCWKKRFRKVNYIEDMQVLEHALSNYHYRLVLRENATNIDSADQIGSVIKMILSKTNVNQKHFKECYLFFEDPLIEGRTVISYGITEVQQNKLITKFQIDFNNYEFTKKLYAGNRNIFICYIDDEDSEIIDNILASNSTHKFKFINKKRIHELFINGKDRLCLNTKLRKGFFNRSPKKIKLSARFIYPLFRILPLKKKMVIFESMWGSKISCNPKSLYEYIEKEHPDYTCVWSLKDEWLPLTGNGIRVRRLSVKYFYYLARSHYLVNNVNFHESYVKRKKQVEVQTMHGTPLKSIGLDVPGDFQTESSKKEYIRKCSNWDYLIVQSNFVADLAKTAFMFDRKFLCTGYPRTDVIYAKNNPNDIRSIKEALGLPTDKKVIMYAPTWRVRNKFELMLDIVKLKEKLSDDYILILRLHHFSIAGWKGLPKDNFCFDLSKYRSIEDLYPVTDILITDYSSVMFDYAILDRPMIFFAYDLDEYGNKLRGFNIDLKKESPGELVIESDEVLNCILNIDVISEKSKDKVDAFKQKYLQYEGPNSSANVFKQMTQ